ncbi:MAG: multidrug effflux MFS transporter [Alphaproteobacteria bacterium]|nr:multidrug effflux MFS transporter [Alphaproteobacteria bacterium]
MNVSSPPAQAPAMSTPTRIPIGLLLLIGALAAIGPFTIDLYLPAFGAIGDDLAARPDAVQRTLSAYFVGLALGQLALGPISDRLGRRGPLLAGLLVYVLASIGCAFAGSIETLTAWRLLQAIGACAGAVTSRAVLRDLFGPRDMARALSLVMLVMGLAPIVAPLAGAALHEWLGWRALFFALSGYGLVALTAVGLGLRETLKAPQRPTPAQVVGRYLGLLRLPAFIGPALAGSLAQAALFVYIASSSFVFTTVYGLEPTGFAVLFGVNAAGLILGSQINERLLRTRSPHDVVPVALLAQGIATAALAAVVLSGAGGLPGVAVPLFFAIACVGFSFPNTTATAMAPVGDRAGLAAALLGTLQFGIAGVATWGVGQLHDGTARPMALAMAAFSLAGGVAWILGARLRPGSSHPSRPESPVAGGSHGTRERR